MCAIVWKRRAEDMSRSSPNELRCYLAYGTGKTSQCKVENRHLYCPVFISNFLACLFPLFTAPHTALAPAVEGNQPTILHRSASFLPLS